MLASVFLSAFVCVHVCLLFVCMFISRFLGEILCKVIELSEEYMRKLGRLSFNGTIYAIELTACD